MPPSIPPASIPTRLTGRRLAWARAAWLALAASSLATLVAGLPVSLDTLRKPCPEAFCHGQLTAGGERALHQLGLTLDFYAVFILSVAGAASFIFFGLAALLLWRKPYDWMALLVSLWFVVWGAEVSSPFPAELMALQPAWRWPVGVSQAFNYVALIGFAFYFPNGRFVPTGMHWLAAVLVLIVALSNLVPGSRLDIMTVSPVLGSLVAAGTFAGCVFAQVYRYRRVSGPVERQQIRWVVLGLAALVALQFLHFQVFGAVIWPALDQSKPAAVLFILADYTLATFSVLLIPLTIGVAILRYRLWDIDVIVRRTLIYSVLTGLLALTYFASVLLLQGVLNAVTGESRNELVTVISTLAIAALFGPLRARVQRAIDRRFYRKKYDAARTLAAFGAQARDVVELEQLEGQLVQVVDETMQPAYVGLWLKPPPTAKP
jgi:hypothetical protein